ncbi:MAG: Fic family protein [Firmicutes bacterium]|nr:Fic family protein [Bacillota bacterium]MBQ4091989.1 Fic family protein [Bacillota bacterium]
MRRFDYTDLLNKKWDNEVINYLSLIHEYKGKHASYMRQNPAELDRLVEIAKVQSTEASNSIEGIRTTETRLRQLMAERTAPRNRDEKEIAGYRDALQIIHENFEYIPLTPNYILQLHKILLSHTDSDFGGKFKNVQNYISATDEKGNRFTLFTPLAPFETEEAMGRICEEYNRAIGEGKVDPLLILPVFIHDFLCIHPFIDGNGRLSRLLTTLLLYRAGYEIGKYISLEAKIAKHKDAYYSSLERSQVDWHDGKDDPTDFVKYFLSTIIAAYRDFDERIAMIAPSSFEIVKSAVEKKIGRFSKRDIMELCPTLSASTVERHLKKMLNAGSLEKLGAGRATIYIRK